MKQFFLTLLSLFFITSLSAKTFDRDTSYFTIPYKKADDLGAKLAKKYGMRFQETSTGCSIDATRCAFCMLFMDGHSRTIEEARPIVHDIAQQLWALARDDSYFTAYFAKACIIQKYLPSTLTNSRIGIRVDFWDKDVNRPLFPFVAQIYLKEGVMYYFYADPKTQALVFPPITEEIEFSFVK